VLAFLGSALRGIDRKLPLPDEVAEDPAGTVEALPADQGAVLDIFERSTVAAELLTPAVIDALVAVRRYEQRTFGSRPLTDVIAALRLAWSC